MASPTLSAQSAPSVPAAWNIRVYNTLSRGKEPFEPLTPGRVGIYLCGPTVYKPSHIGHMVGPVIFDTIKRFLSHCGYQVTFVVNITDVDDKLIHESQLRGITMAQLAQEMTADYLANITALGVRSIDHFPRATEHMSHIIQFTQALLERGYAYVTSEGDVYFDVTRDDEYGKLSHRTLESQQGAGGDMAERKRGAHDFALWKSAKPGEPSWESPWGPGRPGWHIECSAMSRALLGESFDIHGGGLDLMFPHHENEIAQSECCHGKPMAKYWLHNGLMQASSEIGKVGGRNTREAGELDAAAQEAGKMGKSKGASAFRDLLAKFAPETIRFFLLSTQYRRPLDYSEERLHEMETALETFYRLAKRYDRITGASFYELTVPSQRAAGEIDPAGDATLAAIAQQRQAFLEALDDDFNTGGAIGNLYELARLLNRLIDVEKLETDGGQGVAARATLTRGAIALRELGGLLGLFEKPPAAKVDANEDVLRQLVQLVVALRTQARQAKDFAAGDRLRDELQTLGVALEDRNQSTDFSLPTDTSQILPRLMALILTLRAEARKQKQFAIADQIRQALTAAGITLQDRPDGTDWTLGS